MPGKDSDDGEYRARAYTSGRRKGMPPATVRAGDDLYRALLELSAEAIARFEIDPPLETALPAAAQVARILRDARIVECNEAFAVLYGRRPEEMVGHIFSDFVPSRDRRMTVEEFVASGYRLVDA